MSQLRKVKIKFDPEIVREAAQELGMEVFENREIYSYATTGMKAPLVIKRGYVEFGITDEGEILYDNMHYQVVKRFVEGYLETLLKRRGISYRKVEGAQQLTFVIGG